MKNEFLASLLVAGLVLSGCQTDSVNGTSESVVSDQNAGTALANRASADNNRNPVGNKKESDNMLASTNAENGSIQADSGEMSKNSHKDGNPGAKIPSDVRNLPDGWYMRTVASATTEEGKVYTHRTAGVFGELKESRDNLDRHDIDAFGTATLYVVFPKVKEEGNIEDYFSDYHHYDPDDQYNAGRQTWTFQVKNETGDDLSNAEIKLNIEGPYKVYKKGIGYEEVALKGNKMLDKLSLVDLDNQKVYAYSELKNADLSMDGKKVRTFQWVLGDAVHVYHQDEEIQTLLHRSVKKQTEKENQALEAMSVSRGSKFGLPPRP